jgi:hypothetical protein
MCYLPEITQHLLQIQTYAQRIGQLSISVCQHTDLRNIKIWLIRQFKGMHFQESLTCALFHF